MRRKHNPYTSFTTDPTFPFAVDLHGNMARTPEELAPLTDASNKFAHYVENQFSSSRMVVSPNNVVPKNVTIPNVLGKSRFSFTG